MASEGPKFPGTAAIADPLGAVTWTNLANIKASDNVWATAALASGEYADSIACTNFSFSIPTTATITGIQVHFEHRAPVVVGTVRDITVNLLYDGSLVGANLADTTTDWPSSETTINYGGSANTWNTSWTPNQINHPTFGVQVMVRAFGGNITPNIDAISITVYYSSAIVSDPKITKPDEVLIFGTRFRLMEEPDGSMGVIRVSQANQPVPKVVTNRDYSRDSSPVHSTVGGDDLTGGMGHWRYIYGPDGNRLNDSTFWTGQNIDTLWPRAVTLGPLATATTASAGLSFHGANVLGNVIATLWGTSVYTWDGTTFTLIDSMAFSSANSQSPTHFNSRLFYPMSGVGSGYAYQSTASGALTSVATTAGPSATTFSTWDDKLYALDTSGILWMSTTGDANSWGTALARVPGGETVTAYAARKLLTFSGTIDEPTLHAITFWGLYAYDAEADKWKPSNFKYRFRYPSHVYKIIAGQLRESLFISPGTREIWKLDASSGGIVATDISINPAPSEFKLELVDWAADNRYIYTLFSRSALDALNNEMVLLWNGQGWHPIRVLTSGFGGDTQRRIAAVSTSSLNRLIYAISNSGASATTSEWINLHTLTNEHPLFSTTRTYATAGQVELPVDDAGYPEQIKTAQEFRIKVLGASNDETVQVSYRLDESTGSYTNLGDAITTTDEVHIPFGSDDEGLEWKAIQLKFTLARGGTTTNSPKIAYWALDFIRNSEVIWAYTLNLDLRKSYNHLSPQQQIDRLKNYVEATLFGTFGYLHDNKTTRSSVVKVLNIQGAEEGGNYPAGVYTVTLLEVGGTSV